MVLSRRRSSSNSQKKTNRIFCFWQLALLLSCVCYYSCDCDYSIFVAAFTTTSTTTTRGVFQSHRRTSSAKTYHYSSSSSSSVLVDLAEDNSNSNSNSNSDKGQKHAEKKQEAWLTNGVLVSSFTDGLKHNPVARKQLFRSLVRSLVAERRQLAEKAVEQSVLQSPCCGPDIPAVETLERMDQIYQTLTNNDDDDAVVAEEIYNNDLCYQKTTTTTSNNNNNDIITPTTLRFVYIPTAMYALRPESTNTPGKQRQRARADGKKRRNEIVRLLTELFTTTTVATNKQQQQEQQPPTPTIFAVTLDLDDGSIKQPEGSDDKTVFPSNGKEALNTWNPHFVFVEGGNTFWLYHCIEKGDWKNDLIPLLCTMTNHSKNNNKKETSSSSSPFCVYCGSSAGAIVVGASMEPACWKEWDNPSVVQDKPSYSDWKGVPGLGFLGEGVSFFPHMTPEWEELVKDQTNELRGHRPRHNDDDNTKKEEEEKATNNNITVHCLSDTQACFVDGTRQTLTIV